jgi:hypothetical protein
MAYRVRVYKWLDGELKFFDQFFNNRDHAVKHASVADGHHAKVYDEDGMVLHEVVPAVKGDSTYA